MQHFCQGCCQFSDYEECPRCFATLQSRFGRLLFAVDPGQSNAGALIDLYGQPILRTYCQYSYQLPPLLALDPKTLPSGVAITVELQWLQGRKNKSAILSLAFDAGACFGRLCERYHATGYALPVDVWKALLFDGARKDKRVHWNLIAKLLTTNETELLPKGPRKWDALSAIGIAWASYLLGPKLEGYRR